MMCMSVSASKRLEEQGAVGRGMRDRCVFGSRYYQDLRSLGEQELSLKYVLQL